VSVRESAVSSPNSSLKQRRKRDFTLVGERVIQQILGVVTSFPNPSQAAARLAMLILTESNQSSEPTATAGHFSMSSPAFMASSFFWVAAAHL